MSIYQVITVQESSTKNDYKYLLNHYFDRLLYFMIEFIITIHLQFKEVKNKNFKLNRFAIYLRRFSTSMIH